MYFMSGTMSHKACFPLVLSKYNHANCQPMATLILSVVILW